VITGLASHMEYACTFWGRTWTCNGALETLWLGCSLMSTNRSKFMLLKTWLYSSTLHTHQICPIVILLFLKWKI
jgi:hypothetical protein